MPTALSDTHDRFTELFGTKRGSDRPEEDPASFAAAPGAGVLCAGGCGARVVPAGTDDCEAQSGPWYCDHCFAEERKKLEARRGTSLCETTAGASSASSTLVSPKIMRKTQMIMLATTLWAIVFVATGVTFLLCYAGLITI